MTSPTTDRRFGLAGNVAFKAPVRAATTASITLSGAQTIDGVACVADDDVLVKNQSTTSQNGIYTVSTAAWTRRVDANGNYDLKNGTLVRVNSGTTQAGYVYALSATDPITVDTTSQTWTAALTAAASSVSFLQAGTGAVSRDSQDKMRDIFSVADFGAVGDGATSDQTAVAAAVAAAYAAGDFLYWPVGTYLTTASVANLHDVQHFGIGIVKRGTDLFYITPKLAQTNTLYVATTGSNSNDGLTVSQPLLTVQKACDIIAESSPRLPGRWVIQIAAGTYTENVTFDSATEGEYPIYIQGPDVTHPSVPTAIISASTTSSPVFQCNVGGHFVIVDVKMNGATTSDGVQTNGSRVTLTNVHITACLNGVKALNGAILTAVGGIWTGRGSGVAGGIGYQGLYCVLHDIGGTSLGTATQVTDYERGLLVNEGTQGHLDYTQVSNCVTGLNIKRGAGAPNTEGMVFTTCTTGVLVENNGWYNNNMVFTGCTVNVKTLGGSPELSFLTASNSARTMRVIESTSSAAWTGSTSESTRWTSPTIPAWVVSQSGHVARVKIWGVATLTASATVTYYINGGSDVSLGALTLTSGVTVFESECWVWHSGASNQRASVRFSANSSANSTATTQNTVALTNTAFTLKQKLTLGNSADSITVEGIVFEATYGG